jgi:hypothetical protein
VENMSNIVEELCNEELHDEMSYIFWHTPKLLERFKWKFENENNKIRSLDTFLNL